MLVTNRQSASGCTCATAIGRPCMWPSRERVTSMAVSKSFSNSCRWLICFCVVCSMRFSLIRARPGPGRQPGLYGVVNGHDLDLAVVHPVRVCAVAHAGLGAVRAPFQETDLVVE